MSDKTIKEGTVMLHPIRWKVLNGLKEKGVEMYIDRIADMVREDRRLVSVHLGILQEHGYLTSEFKIVEEPHSKGKAGRFFKLTPKFDKMRADLVKVIKS
jgi:DNA-binding transcriptional ArsR family regulator